MTTPVEMHPLAETYVSELRHAARRLPRAQRNELIAEIRAHLRDKLVGTLVVPGGYATAAYALVAASSVQACSSSAGRVTCTGGPTTLGTIGQVALSVFVFVGPLAAAFYLAKRARQ